MLKKRKKTEMLTFNFLFFSFLPRLLTPHLSKILLCYDLCLLIVDVPLYSKKMLSNQCVNPPIKKCCQINVWIQSKSLTATQSSWWSYWSLVLAVSSYSSLLWLCATGKSVIHSMYIRTLSSYCLLSDLQNWLMGDLVRTTCIVYTRL